MYVLHCYPDTASLVVRIALADLGVPHECRLIDRAAGALDSPAYRAMHPLGKIPALETPDGPMFETAAMLLYLADRHQALAPAPTAPDRAAFLKWLFFVSTNVHPTLLQLFYPERTAGPACVDAVAAHAHDHMHLLLTALEAMVAADHPVWLSAKPSILGYYLGMLLHWLSSMPQDHPAYFATTDFPALHAVLAALETQAAVQSIAADEDLGTTPFTNTSN